MSTVDHVVRTTAGADTSRVRPARGDATAGALAMLPFIAGYAPFALVIGAAVADHGDELAGWSGSWLVYGGSAQLAALRGIDAGVVLAVAAGLLVNARLLVYSASLAGPWREQPRWFRMVAAALIIDPTWALAQRRAGDGSAPRAQRRFFLGAGVALGIGWSALMAIGVMVGSAAGRPELEIAAPLCLSALIGPPLAQAGNRAPIIVSAAVTLATLAMPAGLGILCAIAAGALAGGVLHRDQEVSS